MQESNVTILDSVIECMWLGAGLRLDDSATGSLKRCDIKHCSYGIALNHQAKCVVDTCALINCTFGAYYQGSDADNGESDDNCHGCSERQDDNSCELTLRNNQVLYEFQCLSFCKIASFQRACVALSRSQLPAAYHHQITL
jgi:hypothetical protein